MIAQMLMSILRRLSDVLAWSVSQFNQERLAVPTQEPSCTTACGQIAGKLSQLYT